MLLLRVAALSAQRSTSIPRRDGTFKLGFGMISPVQAKRSKLAVRKRFGSDARAVPRADRSVALVIW